MSNNNGEVEKKENGISFLLDPKYPLLQRYRDLCPGSFKHSQNLSSMVEGVALALEIDSNNLKLAALYHDIGKTFNPIYFSENQLDDESPHANITPKMSYEIITRHVSDSVLIMINDGNFPLKVINMVAQHHGQSVLKYFFIKSNSDNDDLYRYRSAKPTCVESAILMICDSIEATSKSKIKSNDFNPSSIINNTINGLIEDGQCDEVYMKLGDLGKIKKALSKEMEGMYQKRVDYDKEVVSND